MAFAQSLSKLRIPFVFRITSLLVKYGAKLAFVCLDTDGVIKTSNHVDYTLLRPLQTNKNATKTNKTVPTSPWETSVGIEATRVTPSLPPSLSNYPSPTFCRFVYPPRTLWSLG